MLPAIFKTVNPSLMETYVCELLKSGEKARNFGLVLKAEDIRSIVEARNNVLQSCGRVELGIEVTRNLMESFCSSTFINDENYVPVLYEMHEIFYYIKNETEDKIPDARLVEIMRDLFENSCGGSPDLLRSTLEVFAEDFRRKQIKDISFEEGWDGCENGE